MRPGDLLRAVTFLSAPAAWAHAGFASGACLFLVCGAVMGIRWLGYRPVAGLLGGGIVALLPDPAPSTPSPQEAR